MVTEGFYSILGTLSLAKELYDLGRYDIVKEHFFDTLSWDNEMENIYGAISSVFSGFDSDYDDDDDSERMVFTDDVISDYYEMAWKYGCSHNVRHDENPYVINAKNEAGRQLNFCYSMGWELSGCTKTKKTARQSKLIVYIGSCNCDNHENLAYGLLRLYRFFKDKRAEFDGGMEAVTV